MGPSPYDWAEKVGLSDFAFAMEMEIEELAGHDGACAGMDDVAWQLTLPLEWVALAEEGKVQARDDEKEKGDKNSSPPTSWHAAASSSGPQPATSSKGQSQMGVRQQQQQDGQRAFDELGYKQPRRQTYSPTEDVFGDASDAWWDCEKERANKVMLGLELEHGCNTRLSVDGKQERHRVGGHGGLVGACTGRYSCSSTGARPQTSTSQHHRAGSTPNFGGDAYSLRPRSDVMA